MPKNTLQEMNTSFGSDFSNVKIHNDSESADMNKELNAHAFTHGSDIYFNSGKYSPESKDGQHLLAHELTHTVQQGASTNGKSIMNKSIEDDQVSRSKKNSPLSSIFPVSSLSPLSSSVLFFLSLLN